MLGAAVRIQLVVRLLQHLDSFTCNMATVVTNGSTLKALQGCTEQDQLRLREAPARCFLSGAGRDRV